MKQRIILHCDVNNFFASCECALNPSIKDMPVAVTGNKEKRTGIVLAKNTIAKSFGVNTGDTIFEAKKKCPDLICVNPHHDVYEKYSRRIRAIYEEYTDKVEPFGIDECWLDITDTVKFFGSPMDVANTLRKRIREEIGVTISVGISFSKIFAKLGSDMKKPDAVTEIPYSNFKKITYHLPINSIIGIGKKLEKKLNALNIFTLGDLANSDIKLLKKRFGVVGVDLYNKVNGIDDNEVASVEDFRQIKSIGNGTTTLVDIHTRYDIKSVVTFLADEIATRLRFHGFMGTTIHVALRKSDLTWVSKSHTTNSPTNTEKDITRESMKIIDELYYPDMYIRSIRISVSNLQDENMQLDLFDTKNNKQKLNKAIDKIRDKYGYKSITPLITKSNVINQDALRIDENNNEE